MAIYFLDKVKLDHAVNVKDSRAVDDNNNDDEGVGDDDHEGAGYDEGAVTMKELVTLLYDDGYLAEQHDVLGECLRPLL